MMNLYIPNPVNTPSSLINTPTLFTLIGNSRPKRLYIDIIGNTKPGCKRCGK